MARGVRRYVRRSAAEKWPVVDGKVTRFEAKDELWQSEFRPVLSFTYESAVRPGMERPQDSRWAVNTWTGYSM